MLTRPLTQPLTGPLVRGAGEGGFGFNPMSLFASGEQGALYYFGPSFAGLYQDSAGTTPVTAVEQPIGLMLDRRFGLARGTELVPNGAFDTADLSAWTTNNASIAVVGGKLEITTTATGSPRATFVVTTVAGATYELVVTLTRGTAPNANQIRAGSIAGGNDYVSTACFGDGIYRRTFIAGSANTYISFGYGETAAGQTSYWDDISLKQIPGNHATQSTAAARPVLSARKNLLLATTTLATQSVTLPATPCTLSFTGSGTVTLSGASTAGPLVGGGSLTFTPTAGSVTFTVTGSVTNAQLEYGAAATRYQRVNTATDYDTAGFPLYLKFDGVDDFMGFTLPAALTAGTIAMARDSESSSFMYGPNTVNIPTNVGFGLAADNSTGCSVVSGNGAAFTTKAAAGVTTTPFVGLVSSDGATIRSRFNLGVAASTAHATNFNGTTWRVGAVLSNGGFLNGRSYGCAVVSRILTGAQEDSLTRFLANLAGVTLP